MNNVQLIMDNYLHHFCTLSLSKGYNIITKTFTSTGSVGG